MSRWPAMVWSAPALRELDERARVEIAAAGALRSLRAEEALYREGEPAEALFAVIAGAVEVREAASTGRRGRVLREARAGDTFGEEAFVEETVIRRADAIAVDRVRVAAIPASLLRRVLTRGASRSAARVGAAMRRAAARERLRSSRLAGGCSEAELDVLLDAVEHVHLARGEALFREGDEAERVFVVASGLVRVARGGPAGTPAHLGGGEVVGEEDVLERRARTCSATAAGPSWLLAIRTDAAREAWRRSPRIFDSARMAREERFAAGAIVQLGVRSAPSVLGDLHRFATARSLVLIDQASCVQCGHCSWSCASAHADGVSRLVRRGEVAMIRAEEPAPARALLVATSCQHCESPACLPACPTAAISQGPRGEVVLREDLCTGCGACAKTCPWEAIRMAPLEGGGSVAVKCDLCAGRDGGPACVEACPTAALVRVEPRAALEDVRVALGRRSAEAGRPAGALSTLPCVAAGLLLATALACSGPESSFASGGIAGAALLALGAHGVWKRIVRRFGRAAYAAHLAVAPIALAAIARHVRGPLHSNAAGALVVVTGAALVSGAWGLVAYLAVPPRLARLAQRGSLPEDLRARQGEIDARAFAELSGRSERVKAVFAHLVRPYMSAPWGAVARIARGGDVRGEEERLRSRIARVLQDRTIASEEIDAIVRTAVESRTLAAQRLLLSALRGWLPVHVVAAAVAIALLAVHAAVVLAYR